MKKIEEIYACVYDDGTVNSEGIMNTFIQGPFGMMNAVMVTSNKETLEKLKILCKESSRQEGKKIKVLKFTGREVLEEIDERN